MRHLKMIVEVADSKNLTRASENLYLSQSALSHQLKEVETFFQSQLFIRQKRQMLLTREGEIVLSASKRILQEIDDTSKQVRQMADKEAGEIRISTECYTSYPWLSGFLKEFRIKYPRVDVKIVAEATHQATINLLNNRIDVGIFEDNKNTKLVYTPLFSDELNVIVTPDHRWAAKKFIPIEELHKVPYIMYNIPTEESSLCQLFFSKSKAVKIYKMMLTEAIFEMVKAGLGFTVQPHWIAYSFLKSKELKAIKIGQQGMKRTWYAAVLKNKIMPPYINGFIQMLSKHMKMSDEAKCAKLLSK
ncbi:MAG TPA: LysR family transcriptional regulator [Flavitalea sp.]|nr:LysR family transcriptional regulator [Flavitalea sp.]